MSTLSHPTNYRLYGYSLSYFSRKLEAALDWYGMPYEFVLKSPETTPALEKRSGTNQVPVLVTPQDECLADTTPIMWMLDERYPERALFPGGVPGAIVQVIEEYLDEWLTRVVMHYRWGYDECTQSASSILGQEAAPQAPQVIASMLTHWGKRVVRARGMSSEPMQQAGEAEWIRLLDHLEIQLEGNDFTLGSRPSAIDAVLLGGLRGHFRPDPVPARALTAYPRISSWIDHASSWNGEGQAVAHPDKNPFVHFMLSEMSGAYRTYILANAQAVRAQEKIFVCDTYGHSVSYKTQPYTEASRLRTTSRLESALSAEEHTQFIALLDLYGLGDIYTAH
jgi:glutathione S-transferase